MWGDEPMPNNLYIVDNSAEELNVKKYLTEWCSVSKQMDIATGYLEVGGLLSIDSHWQKLDKIRIILGNEMTKRTKDVIDEVVRAMLSKVKDSMDEEQDKNDFLKGVPAILDAMLSGKIECRVFDKNKFHAKAYITYFRDEYRNQFIQAMNIPAGYALVGSSNFTKAGLTQNIELNVQVKDDVEQLQDWFESHWNEGMDITEAVIEVIKGHCKEYLPYDVYLRSMYEYFKSREESVSEWENHESIIYRGLSQYQRDGYNNLVEIANRYSGAFLCDGVGLGKTFVGLMLIERYVKKERKKVVLIVPASARKSVWEVNIKKYIPEILNGFSPFIIINHTDLLLENRQDMMERIQEEGEIIIIDEAHHFRNRGSNRYRKLFEMMENGCEKKLYMLTATPINNSFRDLQHLIELFTHRDDEFFMSAPLGIPSLQGHFKKMEAKLSEITEADVSDAVDVSDDIFRGDQLVNQLVVQRSRAYVKKSLSAEEGEKVIFSLRQPPTVADYSLVKSYGSLIDDFVKSFYRKDKNGKELPILALAVYSPYEEIYFKGDRSRVDDMEFGRQAQVVNLIRQLLLKRFESSIAAFQETCVRIYVRLKKFLLDYQEYGNIRQIERLLTKQEDIIIYVERIIDEIMQSTVDEMEDDLPDYIWNTQEVFSVDDFDIRTMLDDTILDMEVLAGFIEDMMNYSSDQDDKIRELKKILLEDKRVAGRKVIIFTEYKATAKYIFSELTRAGFDSVYEIDGQTKGDRHALIQRFSPYYNGTSSSEIENEIKILIATDVLAEGLNLQDASCLINYELHWNPVRLMQRIGRIDRRRNVEIEKKLLEDHPDLCLDRGNAYYWNFLPPQELEQLLSLYHTVSKKTLRISKTFGIEGKKLLTPEDDFEALKEFNSQYEGQTSGLEEMALAYQELLSNNPQYLDLVHKLPRKMFSAKSGNKKGYFFCFELPIKKVDGTWSNGDGFYRWYFYDEQNNSITDSTYDIWQLIKCEETEQRVSLASEEQFYAAKSVVEDFLKKSYIRKVQAPVGKKVRLVTWMQIG